MILNNFKGSYRSIQIYFFFGHGIPQILISDYGPQFSSQEFTRFSRAYNISHISSSHYFPRSNGQAETTVQTVKYLVRDSDDPYLYALLQIHTTGDAEVWIKTDTETTPGGVITPAATPRSYIYSGNAKWWAGSKESCSSKS